jgi:DNA-binding Xre family transcriptional regulator
VIVGIKGRFVPYELKIDAPFSSQGWKIKIREKERLEPPHVTLIKIPRKQGLAMKAYLLTEERDAEFSKGIAKKNAKVIPRSKFISELRQSSAETVWITDHSEIIEDALRKSDLFKIQENLKKRTNILILGKQNFTLESTLVSLFKKAFVFPLHKGLSIAEILEIFSSANPSDLIIGGVIKDDLKTLVLTRGDLSTVVVPLSTFRSSGDGTKPDFSVFSIVDGGQTLRFGNYEASVESVLYEYDSEYRRQLKAERARSEKTFAACLKRLRLQKGLLQSDFPGVDEKVIGRLERGEVNKPQVGTLKKIASALGVKAEDIMSY